MADRKRSESRNTDASGVRVIGAPRTPLRDGYHYFLRVSWAIALSFLIGVYLTLNLLYALAYVAAGGIANARPGSYRDAFFFSIQTMGTIGYGAMYPATPIANALVVAESVTGLLVTAVVTGLVFAKFSRPTARVLFSRNITIGPMDGVPTLSFRVGNERGNRIMEAQIRVAMVRTEHTREGMTFYRMLDLVLTRDRTPALTRSWSVLHPITPNSPMYGSTPESLARDEVEFMISLAGVDDTSFQPVHATARYTDKDVAWGARLADVLHEDSDGTLVMDARKFHDVLATPPTEGFPYSLSG